MFIKTNVRVLPAATDQWHAFGTWVAESCSRQSNVLEIGAGRGNFGYPARIREQVGRLVGIDPDSRIRENPYLAEFHQCSLEDYAEHCTTRYDCAYAFYVLEHIAHPEEFFRCCRRLLTTGGVFLAATPNLWHYFGMATRLANVLGVEESLLRLVRGNILDSYHYPTRYRANSLRAITALLERAGFREVEFTLLDNPERTECYFPRLLRFFPRAYSRLVYRANLPELMGTIFFRARA